MFASSQPFHEHPGNTMGEHPGITMGAVAETPKGKVEEKQATLPVTIRSIEVAAAQHSGDGEVLFYGTQPGMFLLVGMVESVSHQAASVELSLNDSTGRIRVRQYGVEPGHPLASVEPGKYILVAGQLRTSPAVHITALSARLVVSPDEISYHMVEVAHAALKLQRGGMDSTPLEKTPQKMSIDAMPTPARAAGPSGFAAVASPVVAAAVAPVGESPLPSSTGLDVRSAIIAVLSQQAASKPEGVPLDSVCGQLKTAAASEVRTVLQQLVDDGEAYTTIDDDHFALI